MGPYWGLNVGLGYTAASYGCSQTNLDEWKSILLSARVTSIPAAWPRGSRAHWAIAGVAGEKGCLESMEPVILSA